MAVFSVNQNRQFYVAKAVTAKGTAPATVGDLSVKGTTGKELYFQHMGHGGLTRSDLIKVDSITYAKYTKAAKLQRKLKQAVVTLDGDVNDGNPINGQDYILRVQLRQYLGNSDYNVGIKYGAVHVQSTIDTASDFYIKMAQSLVLNFSREVIPVLEFALKTASGETAMTLDLARKSLSDAKKTLTGTYTGVIIREVEQPWRLGVYKQEPVYFEVIPATVTFNGDEVQWGKKPKLENSTKVVKNGKQIADLEYFCMGERGDQYRAMNWPNNIVTKYLVDPDKEYNVLDIHYSFSDEGIGVQKSEKDITIVSDSDLGPIDTDNTLLKQLAALGVTVTTTA